MSDEQRRDDRTGEADHGHEHPEGQSPERQQRVQTPVRLAGFPEPREAPPSAPHPEPPLEAPASQHTPPEEDASEDNRTNHTGDDLSNEPADSSTLESGEGSVCEERTTGLPQDEVQDRADSESADSESADSRHRPAHDQRYTNGGARSSGTRLVVPASRPPDGVGEPGQQESPPEPPAAEDESGAAASALARDEGRRQVGRTGEQAHPTAEPVDTTSNQDRATIHPSQGDQPISASDSPAAADDAPQAAASETPDARSRATQRELRNNASHQQTISDPHESSPESSSAGGGSEPYSAGEPHTRTEPSPHKRTSKAHGRSRRVPWRALALASAVLIVLGAGSAGAFALWQTPAQEGSGAANQPQSQDRVAQSEQAGGSAVRNTAVSDAEIRDTDIRDTGVAFEALSVEGSGNEGSGDEGSDSDGEGDSGTVDVSLRADVAGGEELVWTGTASGAAGDGQDSLQQSPQDARSISLSGEGSPTSANFQAGFEMPTAVGTNGGDGEVQSGVLARTEAGEPVTHATYQRLGPAAEEPSSSNVSAQGSYYIADDEGVIAEGSYTDSREDGSTRVVRTYTEDNPATSGQRRFLISFEAPPSTPIPTLVGWQPPQDDG